LPLLRRDPNSWYAAMRSKWQLVFVICRSVAHLL
jgi:hypothetical protein